MIASKSKCTCPESQGFFTCSHIIYVLSKVLRLSPPTQFDTPKTTDWIFKPTFTQEELEEIFRNGFKNPNLEKKRKRKVGESEGEGKESPKGKKVEERGRSRSESETGGNYPRVILRSVSGDSPCPICEFLSSLPFLPSYPGGISNSGSHSSLVVMCNRLRDDAPWRKATHEVPRHLWKIHSSELFLNLLSSDGSSSSTNQMRLV